MFREDLYNVFLTVEGADGRIVKLQMDKFTGGAATSKSVRYRPSNGLENQLTLGGPKETEKATLTRLYESAIDSVVEWLLVQAGRANVTVTKQPIDEDGHNFGHALVYTGKLTEVKPPPTDSESDKAALCEFMVELEGHIGTLA